MAVCYGYVCRDIIYVNNNCMNRCVCISLDYLEVFLRKRLYHFAVLVTELHYNCFYRIMHSVALYVTGNDEYGRMVRRTLMRYLNLTLILVLRSISSAVKRRFPTHEHLVEAGAVCRQYTDYPVLINAAEIRMPIEHIITGIKQNKSFLFVSS